MSTNTVYEANAVLTPCAGGVCQVSLTLLRRDDAQLTAGRVRTQLAIRRWSGRRSRPADWLYRTHTAVLCAKQLCSCRWSEQRVVGPPIVSAILAASAPCKRRDLRDSLSAA